MPSNMSMHAIMILHGILMISMLKRKMFLKNMINRGQVKVNVLTVENLVISVKIAIKNLVN